MRWAKSQNKSYDDVFPYNVAPKGIIPVVTVSWCDTPEQQQLAEQQQQAAGRKQTNPQQQHEEQSL